MYIVINGTPSFSDIVHILLSPSVYRKGNELFIQPTFEEDSPNMLEIICFLDNLSLPILFHH